MPRLFGPSSASRQESQNQHALDILNLTTPSSIPLQNTRMSSSSARGGERVVAQDYIARIRYSNALPPPPNPPKLLEIPNTGLASGQYTTPGFASRLARDQPLNIEADAELGMPLDLVGMPGIFDGDESCKYTARFYLRNCSPYLCSYPSTTTSTGSPSSRSSTSKTPLNTWKAKVLRFWRFLLAPNRIYLLLYLEIKIRQRNLEIPDKQ